MDNMIDILIYCKIWKHNRGLNKHVYVVNIVLQYRKIFINLTLSEENHIIIFVSDFSIELPLLLLYARWYKAVKLLVEAYLISNEMRVFLKN